MVDRFRAELLPNGMVRLFDNSTLSATLFETCGYGEGGRRVITLHSGPEVMDKAGWDAAYAAFPLPRSVSDAKHDALWYAWGHIDGGNYPAEFDSAYGFAFRDWYNARRAAYYRGESGLIAGMIDMWRTFASAGRTDFGN